MWTGGSERAAGAARPGVVPAGVVAFRPEARLVGKWGLGDVLWGLTDVLIDQIVLQGCPTFRCLWAALEDKEFSWATH